MSAENETQKQLRQEWETPPEFYAAITRRWKITLDVCAHAHNAKNTNYIAPETNALAVSWGRGEMCWCNPGFRNVGPWLVKAFDETKNKNTTLVLTHAGIAARWFADALENCDRLLLLAPRINFVEPASIKQSSNPRDSVLWVFSPSRGRDKIIQHWNWRS